MPERAEVGVKRCPKRFLSSGGQVDHNPNIFAKCLLHQHGITTNATFFLAVRRSHMQVGSRWKTTSKRAPLKLESLRTAQFHLEIEMASDNAKFGFVEFAEKWNGRMAMLGFTIGLATEAVTGSGILKQLGL
eukprot:g72874.t1